MIAMLIAFAMNELQCVDIEWSILALRAELDRVWS